MKRLLPRLFDGRAVIVASGPSLAAFPWRRLDGLPVLAVNRAYEAVPGAVALYWSDWRFMRWHEDALRRHAAPFKAMISRRDLRAPSWTSGLEPSGTDGYEPEHGKVRTGNSSGYAAVNLAVHLGATERIALLGFDYRFEDGRAHWHDDHPVITRERVFTEKMAPFFPSLASELAKIGVAVLNGSLNSRIECWPRSAPLDALEWIACAEAA